MIYNFTDNKKCDKEISTLITRFVKDFRLLQKKFPNEDLRGTSVGSDITDEIYTQIHLDSKLYKN